jgi:putative ABC transport system permease protein
MMRAAGVFRTNRRERELADEIESHLQIHADDNIRRGLSPDAARRAAVLKLGGVESLKERYRDQQGLPSLEHLVQDFRYAARTLRRTPGLTAVALVTLALGIAGPTAVFSMIKSWILEPLPFARPDTLIDLRYLDTSTGNYGRINPADFLDLARSTRTLEELAAYRSDDYRLTGGDRPERAQGASVTPNFFRLIGAQAALGRVFNDEDRKSGSQAVTVLSHGLWRERFNADPSILGRSVELDGRAHIVVGVLPESFQFTLLGRANVWTPLVFTPEETSDRRSRSVIGLGRLRDGIAVDQARAELGSIAAHLAKAYPDTNATRGVRVLRLADEIRLHHDMGFLLPVLFGMVGCVLLIACVNVTNVMLARASARRHETAVRIALGASRSRIGRQWVIEHLIVFVGAGAAGAALAVYATDWITTSIPFENRGYLRNYGVVTVDRAVLLFALAVGALCGMLFGWLTAWTGVKADVNADLRDASGRTTTATRGNRLRAALVVAEVSLALGLLISSGLLVQTARNITRVDVGFDSSQLLTFRMLLDDRQYQDDAAIRVFYERLTSDLRGRPAVLSAAAGSFVPFARGGDGTEFFIEGRPDPAPKDTPGATLSQITAGYEDTLRLRVVGGRRLGAGDSADGLKVAMINETLAHRHFANRDAIGQRLRLGRLSPESWTIVGVVADVKNYETVDASEPQIYVPFAQRPSRLMTVVVRTSGDPEALVGTVRDAVAGLDPAEPISRVFAMDALIGHVTTPFRTTSTFVSFFGLITLLLAGVGVYGVVSYNFSQRTREIGLRMALGARRADVVALVLKQIRAFMLLGLAPGLALAWVLGQAMKGMLVGVTPTDWRLYVGMSLLLAMVALLAALVPARRATAVDPMTALRHE